MQNVIWRGQIQFLSKYQWLYHGQWHSVKCHQLFFLWLSVKWNTSQNLERAQWPIETWEPSLVCSFSFQYLIVQYFIERQIISRCFLNVAMDLNVIKCPGLNFHERFTEVVFVFNMYVIGNCGLVIGKRQLSPFVWLRQIYSDKNLMGKLAFNLVWKSSPGKIDFWFREGE